MKSYAQYVLAVSELAESFTGGAFVSTRDANYGKKFDFKRVGIRHVSLVSGCRSSLPHAESHEEEFVFVISGRPHVWIDGFVHQLKPDCAVGFPAGTGSAHCFINNTTDTVELLIFGERTKKENLCAFPVNPEQRESCGIFWADAPTRQLGPHDGTPHAPRAEEVGKEWPSCIVDCRSLKKSHGWHYPGDTETFSDYVRLTNHLGLKKLGIGYETLRPGRRSAFPHAHKLEEEFAFVLSGSANIWLNGFVHQAKPGVGIAFVPGTNIAHSIINDSDKDVLYLVVGEATDERNEDRVFYPQHAFRNEQCRLKKDIWEDRPHVEKGPHDGRSRSGIREHLALRHAGEADSKEVLEVFQGSMSFFVKVDGCKPTAESVHKAMLDIPKKTVANYRKEFLLIDFRDEAIGIAEIHINHPGAGFVYVGLLLLKEDQFGKGLGRRSYELVEDYVKRMHDAKTMRLGISESNDVSAFWRKMGFSANGHMYPWQGENKTSRVLEFDKVLDSP